MTIDLNLPENKALDERLIQVVNIINRMNDRDEKTEDIQYDPVTKKFYRVVWWSNMSYRGEQRSSGNTADETDPSFELYGGESTAGAPLTGG